MDHLLTPPRLLNAGVPVWRQPSRNAAFWAVNGEL
jgi:hypothetical protein